LLSARTSSVLAPLPPRCARTSTKSNFSRTSSTRPSSNLTTFSLSTRTSAKKLMFSASSNAIKLALTRATSGKSQTLLLKLRNLTARHTRVNASARRPITRFLLSSRSTKLTSLTSKKKFRPSRPNSVSVTTTNRITRAPRPVLRTKTRSSLLLNS
jgi:hypothetical protein